MTNDEGKMTNEEPVRRQSGHSSFTIRHSSLRMRILLWHGLLLACVLAAFGITAHRLHWNGELVRLDRALDEPLSALHRSMHFQNAREGNPPGPRSTPPQEYALPAELAESFETRGIEFSVWSRTGRLLAHSAEMPEAMARPPVEGAVPFVIQRRSREHRREAFLTTPPGECFLAAVSMVNEQQAAARLGWWLLALGAAVLGAGLLVDAWILRRAIQPVEEIIGAAERISRGKLSTRIETRADSAELARLTKVLNETFASLDRAFTQQARFSADVAHELRTPVSVLIAEAQGALERERGGAEYRETISTTLRSARRMSGLIESLLELAQIESGGDLTRSRCDLAVLASEALESLRGMAATHQVTFEMKLEKSPCEANAAQITQIIANLLINAIQHNERAGHARIETGQEDGRAFLRIENSGPGIPAADLPHVFERFYRADTSRSRRTGGVGLGLAICKAIADTHGATLSVESGGGLTCFKLTMGS
ncbi:MAG: HAMP domain-containing protein [Prosthecobacter sp.]|jgi:two-component system OmpR family sensor kinase|uniref:sensor histidine kinase n=1 Tax=Prosthecobacter sp. TaxID=1965333 RepID=UPI001A020A80|nr:ATP-binding protein [Prosthecobacter sp.]MBE2282191.1 HAMP domain-containing protein [Prosthecobacter sp.]